MSDLDVDTFCSRCVDPMGEESDHVQLVALTDALQVSWWGGGVLESHGVVPGVCLLSTASPSFCACLLTFSCSGCLLLIFRQCC
jgi:hypothetical protein